MSRRTGPDPFEPAAAVPGAIATGTTPAGEGKRYLLTFFKEATMKKVLIAYFSASGVTGQMAEYIAEGVRIGGGEAHVKKIEDAKTAAELSGYEGYIFGSPTYSLDVPGPMKEFLDLARAAGLQGKMIGSFGSYTHDVGYQHDAHAPALIMEILERDAGMKPFELGPFAMKEDAIGTGDGLKTCHDYGRVFGEKLGA
jgi:flavorubredoxin